MLVVTTERHFSCSGVAHRHYREYVAFCIERVYHEHVGVFATSEGVPTRSAMQRQSSNSTWRAAFIVVEWKPRFSDTVCMMLL
jgi:hypothetical protein